MVYFKTVFSNTEQRGMLLMLDKGDILCEHSFIKPFKLMDNYNEVCWRPVIVDIFILKQPINMKLQRHESMNSIFFLNVIIIIISVIIIIIVSLYSLYILIIN